MKRFGFLLAIVFATSGLMSSCDSMLDVPAESVISSSSFWRSEEDASAGLNGVYVKFRDAFKEHNFFMWGDYRMGYYCNNIANGYVNYGNIWDNLIDPATKGTDWTAIYNCINACNLVITKVPGIKFASDAKKNNVLGQAYFVRAFCYWEVVRLWGNAPLMTVGIESDDPDLIYPSRQPVEDVFALIESDIAQAESLLGSSNGKFKANLATAYLLDADVNLWQAKVNKKGNDYLNKASQALDKFDANNTASLSSSYENVFRDDNNAEIIFSIPFIQDENTSCLAFICITSEVNAEYRNNPIPVGASTQWLRINDSHYDFLHEDPSDTRADINAMVYNAPNGEVYRWVNKYNGTLVNGTRYYDSDYKVYRYADAVMLKAEILNELGKPAEAIAKINTIAKRAYGKDNYYNGSYSKDQVTEIITNERLKEFASEGKLWFDMVRLGKAFEKVAPLKGRQNEKGILLWPVANKTINDNPNMIQTEGY